MSLFVPVGKLMMMKINYVENMNSSFWFLGVYIYIQINCVPSLWCCVDGKAA